MNNDNIIDFSKHKKIKIEEQQKTFDELFPPLVVDVDIEDFVKLSIEDQFNYFVKLLSKENQELRNSYNMCTMERYMKIPCVGCAMYAASEPMREIYQSVYGTITSATDFEWGNYIILAELTKESDRIMFAYKMTYIHDHVNARQWKAALLKIAEQWSFNPELISSVPWFDLSKEEIEKFVQETSNPVYNWENDLTAKEIKELDDAKLEFENSNKNIDNLLKYTQIINYYANKYTPEGYDPI